MVGLDLQRADLSGLNLSGVNFTNANLRAVDFSNTNLTGAIIVRADLSRANLHMADFTDADLSATDMSMSYGKATLFQNTRMWGSVMRHVMYKNAIFYGADLFAADIAGSNLIGARFDDCKNTDRMYNKEHAHFYWWMNPMGGKPSYVEKPGWYKLERSILGGLSFEENSNRI